MAQICPYKGRKCSDCPHHRYDEDYGDKACFLKQDLSKEEYEQQQLRMTMVVIQRQKEKQEGR